MMHIALGPLYHSSHTLLKHSLRGHQGGQVYLHIYQLLHMCNTYSRNNIHR